MKNRFTKKAENALNNAQQAAAELGHTYIGSEHLLLGLMQEQTGVAARILESKNLQIRQVREQIIEYAGTGSRSAVSPRDMTPRLKHVIERSAELVSPGTGECIGTEHLLLALLQEKDSSAAKLIAASGVSYTDLRADLLAFLERNEADGEKKKADPVRHAMPHLSSFGKNLTALALEGKLDPIIGREEETEHVIRILSRRQKNNPCLIGEPGVGKTAVVEGLAQRIADGNVPDSLQHRIIITLDISSMIAGAKYRGEFEERLKNVMEEASRNRQIILFIDELHVIIGAGAAEGAVDAANILKPALARGELQVIGATTITEYRKHIEKDSALERRFQPVTVGEPSQEQAMHILQGLRAKYEAHHRLAISDAALQAAVSLSCRYLPERFLPDKALDLLDEAAAHLRIRSGTSPLALRQAEQTLEQVQKRKADAIRRQEFEEAARLRDEEASARSQCLALREKWESEKDRSTLTLTEEDVATVLAKSTGLPVCRPGEEERMELVHLQERLAERIVGQEEAIEAIARCIKRGRAGLRDPRRPLGSFLFLGPTGVGKTEVARTLAQLLFGEESALIRVDMSEYAQGHSSAKLIGAPPGYVGYEEGGQLTEQIRRRPYSVVLFDEVEKAHPELFNVLLQLLEDGHLTDAQGRTADFKNCIVILTSNLGAEQYGVRPSLGFQATDSATLEALASEERIKKELRSSFRPEFLNRLDEIIYFKPLGEENLRKIAGRMLGDIAERAAMLGVDVEFSPSVQSLCVRVGSSKEYGARPLRRSITRLVEDPLSDWMLAHPHGAGTHLRITAENDAQEVSFEEIATPAVPFPS